MAASAGGMNRFYLILGGLAVAGAAVLAALTLRKPAVSIPANATVGRNVVIGARVDEAAFGPSKAVASGQSIGK